MGPEAAMPTESDWLGSSRIAKVVTDHWVRDLRATVEAYSTEYGLGPWKLAELKAPLVHEVHFRGEPAHIEWLAAMTEVGPLAIEVLQVVGGSDAVVEWAAELPDRYWHFVAYHRELADAEASCAEFVKRGYSPLLNGRVGGTKFFMFETGTLFGRMFEIAGGDLSGVDWQSL